MLYIARDGILRRKEWYYDRKTKTGAYYCLPMRSYLDYDSGAFLKMLGDSFEMEDGLTVRELFRNFRPWADVMEGIACMAFEDFCAEAEKEPTGTDGSPGWDKFSHVQISGFLEIGPVPEFHRVPRVKAVPREDGLYDGDDVFRSLGMGKPKITDRLDLEIRWSSLGMLYTPEHDEHAGMDIEGYGLDHSPVCDWAHLPLRIDRKLTVNDGTQMMPGHYLSISEPLFNPNHPWVKAKRADDGRVYSYEIEVEYDPSFYECMVRGVFWDWGFHYSPVQRDAVVAEIRESVAELDAARAEGRPVRSTKPDDDDEEDSDPDLANEHKGYIVRSIMADDKAAFVIPVPERDEDE